MHFSIKDALLSWRGCLCWEEKKEGLESNSFVSSLCACFLSGVGVRLGSSSLSLFDFIDWLGYKGGKSVVFCVSLAFFGLVYIVNTLGSF